MGYTLNLPRQSRDKFFRLIITLHIILYINFMENNAIIEYAFY